MRPSRILLAGAVAAVATLALTSGSVAQAAQGRTVPSNTSDGTVTAPGADLRSALVQLNGDPLSTSPRTRPAQGKKIDFSSEAVRSERARLSALRNDFKAWLRANAPTASVTSEYDISLNAVAVKLGSESLSTIARAPQVRTAQYQFRYQPVADDPDLSLISAVQAWNRAGGAANAGAGVKVAIVDTGIDVTHPCFSDAGYPAVQQLGDRRFTNNKIISAKVFYNKAGVSGLTPEALQEHGTHVAGTAACNAFTPASVSGIRDLLTVAVDDLDQANMVVAVAAGNSGPGHFTIESPGSAARALTAGASTVPHFVGAPVTAAGVTYGAAAGSFATVTSDLTAPLAVVTSAPINPATGLSIACSALPAGSLTGKIALISRGTCTFSEKIRNAQDAGAILVLVVNNVAGDPIAMGLGGIPNEPTVPAYMLGRAEGVALAANPGAATTVSATLAYFSTANADIMAGFSSQGPTDVDFRVKPDVVAPGVNVLSSIPHQFCPAPPCFAFFQGTSMATPHLAGSAAVVKSQHPGWSAAQIRSAVVNTADQGVLTTFDTGSVLVTDVNIMGTGRENLLSAVQAVAALDPVSTSFGAVPAVSGVTKQTTVTITNLGGASRTYALSLGPVSGLGVSFAVSPSSVTLAAGQSATVTVTMTAVRGAGAGDHSATLRVSSGGSEVAHAAVYVLIK